MPRTKYTKEVLEPIVRDSISMREVLLKLNLKVTGGNRSHITMRIKNAGISTEHFLGQGWSKGIAPPCAHTKETFTKEVLCKDGKGWKGSGIKLKLYEYNLKEEFCEICGQGPNWNGKKLTLQLDHINGDHFDNSIDNLRIVCPNCHTQTETFGTKNIRPCTQSGKAATLRM